MDDRSHDTSSDHRRDGERISRGSRSSDSGRLTVPATEGMILLPHHDLVRLNADGAYTRVHLLDGKSLLVCKGMGDLHHELPLERFFRCLHAHVINLAYAVKIIRTGGYRVQLCTGDAVEVARRRWKDLIAAIAAMRTWH